MILNLKSASLSIRLEHMPFVEREFIGKKGATFRFHCGLPDSPRGHVLRRGDWPRIFDAIESLGKEEDGANASFQWVTVTDRYALAINPAVITSAALTETGVRLSWVGGAKDVTPRGPRQTPKKLYESIQSLLAGDCAPEEDEDAAANDNVTVIEQKVLTEEERGKRYKTLSATLKAGVYGQAGAVAQIARAAKLHRSGLAGEAPTAGSLLLVGPEGSGKATAARTLARHLCGDEQGLCICVDAGAMRDADELKSALSAVPDDTLSVLILDRVDDVYPEVAETVRAIALRGRIPAAENHDLSFANTIVAMLASSHAGAEYLAPHAAVAEFRPLDRDAHHRILRARCDEVSARLKKDWNVYFTVPERITRPLAARAAGRRHGAGLLVRAFEEAVTAPLAEWLVDNESTLRQAFGGRAKKPPPSLEMAGGGFALKQGGRAVLPEPGARVLAFPARARKP